MDARDFEKKTTLGFKIMSGYYSGRISKNDVSILAQNNSIPWGSREVDKTLNDVGSQVLQNTTFKYLESWNISMIDLMSDAVAVNFILVMRKDWERKGKPKNASSSDHKKFQKNALILLDRSIFEYITKQWRGSSDSRIALNLRHLDSAGELFDPVKNSDWEHLVNEMVDGGTIGGQSYVETMDKRARLLLYYYYIIRRTDAPNPSSPDYAGVDVDHIIPKSLFDSTPNSGYRHGCNNVFNLALLPKKQNISKSDWRLNEVTDEWLKRQIVVYEEIPEAEFAKYSDVAHIDDLRAYRGERIKKTLTAERKSLIES